MQNDQTNPTAQPKYVAPKSATVAGLLGIFFGSFGAHNWYLGDTKKGLMHVCLFGGGFLVTIFGALLAALTSAIPFVGILIGLIALIGYLAIIANGIWGFIEGIIILSQGDAGLAAKGYPVAVPQVYVQHPAQPAQPAQPTQPAAEDTTDQIAEAPAAKPAETKAKTEKKADDKKAA